MRSLLDDQYIVVATFPHGAACSRPEQYDFLWLGSLNNALNEISDHCR